MATQARRLGIDLVSTGVAAAFATLLVTIVAFVIASVSGAFKWYEVVAGAVIVTTIFVSTAFFVVWFLSRPLLERLDEVMERFRNDETLKRAEWLISSVRLKEIEKSTSARHIWIITRSLEEEIEANLFGSVVQHNLSRGVEYTYFLPNDAALRARIGRMKDKYQSPRLVFKVITDPLFDIISMADMAIFGAAGKGARELAGYMNLPIREGGNDYFVALGAIQSERIVGILSAITADEV